MTKVESTTAELKEFIFQLLKHYKIASVSYSFSGSGDSGEFTDTEVTMEEGVEEVDIDELYDDTKKAIKFEMINISNGKRVIQMSNLKKKLGKKVGGKCQGQSNQFWKQGAH